MEPPSDRRVPGTATATTPELTVSRVIDAPPALVFKAWTSEQAHPPAGGDPRASLQSRARWMSGRVVPIGWSCARRRARTTRKRGVYREIVAPTEPIFSPSSGRTPAGVARSRTAGDRYSGGTGVQWRRLTLHQTMFDSRSSGAIFST